MNLYRVKGIKSLERGESEEKSRREHTYGPTLRVRGVLVLSVLVVFMRWSDGNSKEHRKPVQRVDTPSEVVERG